MKKSELRQVLKPLIKECIKEVIFEEGILSNIVSEVAQGLGGQRIVEQAPPAVQEAQQEQARAEEQERIQQKLQETRKRMLDAIGGDAYNGVDVFAGTTPAPAQAESKQGDPLSGVDPRDPGVDINQLFGGASKNWSGMIK